MDSFEQLLNVLCENEMDHCINEEITLEVVDHNGRVMTLRVTDADEREGTVTVTTHMTREELMRVLQ